jgi:hypothetical protein
MTTVVDTMANGGAADLARIVAFQVSINVSAIFKKSQCFLPKKELMFRPHHLIRPFC